MCGENAQFDMQEEFMELTNSSSDKGIHETQNLVTFWFAVGNNYPWLAYNALQVVLPFSQRIYVNQPSIHLSASNRKIETSSLMLKLIYDAH